MLKNTASRVGLLFLPLYIYTHRGGGFVKLSQFGLIVGTLVLHLVDIMCELSEAIEMDDGTTGGRRRRGDRGRGYHYEAHLRGLEWEVEMKGVNMILSRGAAGGRRL